MIITWLTFLIFSGFTFMAYDDYRRQSVDNKVTAILWILVGLALFMQQDINSFAVLILSFGFIYLINELFYSRFKNALVAWGDVLLVPLFLAFVYMQGIVLVFGIILGITLVISTPLYAIKYGKEVAKVKVPLITYLFLPLILAIIYSLIA